MPGKPVIIYFLFFAMPAYNLITYSKFAMPKRSSNFIKISSVTDSAKNSTSDFS